MISKAEILSFVVQLSGRLVDSEALAGYALRDALTRRLSRAHASGAVRTVYDIGANKGQWARFARAAMPHARLICFEGNPAHGADLRRLGLEYFIGVLTRPGISEVEFFSSEDPVGSTGGSIYKEKTPQYRGIEGVRLPARSLDEVVEENNLPQPDLIKVDTQGSELDVIAGGEKAFRNAKYVLMELPVVEYNAGAPSFDVYLRTLRDMGFVPAGVFEIHHHHGIVAQLDFLFSARRLVEPAALAALEC